MKLIKIIEDYYGHWCKVSFETFKEFKKFEFEIDNLIAKKDVEMNRLKSKPRSRNIEQTVIDTEIIKLSGEITGLIDAQILLGRMLIGDKNVN